MDDFQQATELVWRVINDHRDHIDSMMKEPTAQWFIPVIAEMLGKQGTEIARLRAENERLKYNRCDDCGGKVNQYEAGCPLCGAPVCCESCCKIAHLKRQLAEARATIQNCVDALVRVMARSPDQQLAEAKK